MAPDNRAAWITHKGATELSVQPAPYVHPEANEILVKVNAVAINPADVLVLGDYSFLIKSYPTIGGCDISGTVVEVGSDISAFKEGDRVFGASQTLLTGDTRLGAFQEYAVMDPSSVGKAPDNVSDIEAAVLPLGIDTAAAGLFDKNALGLHLPPSSEGKGKTLIVWGGSSSVGANAIQLAVAAGYEIFTLASKHNHDLCLSLGASQVFDYKDPNVEEAIVNALKGKECVGAFIAIAAEDAHSSLCKILAQSGSKKLLSSVNLASEKLASDGVTIVLAMSNVPRTNEIGVQIYGKFIEGALRNGTYKCKPDPVLAGEGLESINKAFQMHGAGVSAQKIVVRL